ncbi:hypothetical protein NEUTE1DRAFT_84070 [Neurospora tetrasperma FGSC 2508]|uniref:Uncharacterized protein n=1 Tax=Neurospora tetrasperma (strain FGSC 2508 / ATCC MYA-4615 / P0657) TaxID=510951 RepID=F8MQM8_NEUT8|nr:uncharacterized protein NEUTE1DRAFT_84070 [Neurospora tetrasperma FGSC 2508]EGO56658.1 hypothetical protein NEUTE1DRAFT_84070 [Neurospora tetrasperma FGSC 2508]EGZ70465.1 hypothetical protein NEUTE2DRAFT_113241 [Neurospora tetrasperma FGSC 2509]
MDSGFRSHRRGASARLRKTFRYPSEDEADDENALEVMDEQEQESLITTLTIQNSQRNSQFRSLLLLIPAIASVPYLLVLFLSPSSSSPSHFPSHGQTKTSTKTSTIFSLLALTSLAATTFITIKLPPTKTGLSIVDSLASSSSSATTKKKNKRLPNQYGASVLTPSPLETWLPYLNVGLCVLVLLTGLVTGGAQGVNAVGKVYLAALPGVIYAATVAAKVVMAGVDPEGELGGLRYGYKGA